MSANSTEKRFARWNQGCQIDWIL